MTDTLWAAFCGASALLLATLLGLVGRLLVELVRYRLRPQKNEQEGTGEPEHLHDDQDD